MKDDQVNSVSEYLQRINFFDPYKKRSKLFFRGQLTKYFNMDPSIARNTKNLANEYNIFIKGKNNNKTNFQNLAYQQHHGIPTRILDMTTDPLVALFFAVNNDVREDSSVYIFIRDGVSADSVEAKLMSFIPSIKSRYVPEIVKSFNVTYGMDLTETQTRQILSHDLFITPNTLKDNTNRRMEEQRGTFAFPANIIKNNKIVGTKHFEDSKSYQEIVIPFEFHEEIFNQLKQKNYSSKILYGDQSKDLFVPNIIKLGKTIKEDHYFSNTKGYFKKGQEFITTAPLLKKREIEKLGYLIAQKRRLDMLTIFFQRSFSRDGVNIVNQFWSEGKGCQHWNSGKRIGDFYCRSQWNDDFYVNRLFFDYPEQFENRKILPESKDALRVQVQINCEHRKLHIKTNLYSGAKLFITSDYFEKKFTTRNGVQDYYFNIDKKIKNIKGQIILLVPSLQSEKFREKAGNDFENLTGSFIKRSNKLSSMILGLQEFNLRVH